MATRQSQQWAGIPCDSDAWPFATDISTFEARRAIGQIVRTAMSLPKLADPGRVRAGNKVLPYLSVANVASQQVEDVIGDLVSEARARGCSWVDIGKALGVRDTAAQKRYGKGLGSERLMQLAYEAAVVRQMAETALGVPDQDLEELLEELEGTTPVDRMRYAIEIIRGSLLVFGEVQEQLKRDEPDPAEVSNSLSSVHGKNILLATTLLSDSEQWRAVMEWGRHTDNPDAANYQSPTAYIYLVMRHVWLAVIWTGFATHQEEPDFEVTMEFFMKANGLMEQMVYLLMRDDVNDALPYAENGSPGEV